MVAVLVVVDLMAVVLRVVTNSVIEFAVVAMTAVVDLVKWRWR